jgi:hypothetical protein
MDRLTLHEKNILHEARTKIRLHLQYLDAHLIYSPLVYCIQVVDEIIDHIDRVKALAEAVVRGDDTKTIYIENANISRKSTLELARKIENWGKEGDITAQLGAYSQTAFSILFPANSIEDAACVASEASHSDDNE